MQCFLGLPIREALRAYFDRVLLSIENAFADAGEQTCKNYAEGASLQNAICGRQKGAETSHDIKKARELFIHPG